VVTVTPLLSATSFSVLIFQTPFAKFVERAAKSMGGRFFMVKKRYDKL
jgi:3-hydroxy-3-methylglutaryl CoA synthase